MPTRLHASRLFLLLLCIALPAQTPAAAQDKEWIKTSCSLDREQVRPGETVNAQVTVEIKEGYHLTKNQTKVSVDAPKGVQSGKIIEPATKRRNLPALGGEVESYEGKGTFIVPLHIAGTASPGEKEIKVKLVYQGCSRTACFLPAEKEFTLHLTVQAGTVPQTRPVPSAEPSKPDVKKDRSLTARFSKALGAGSYGAAAMLAFLAGILLSLTPCVYPMIPITIGIIGTGAGGSRSRGFVLSLVYVLGIATMFSTLGVIAGATGSIFGQAAGNPKFVAPLTALFVVLGFAMMGAFELQLPPALVGKFGGKKGAGIVGVFLMGFLGGVVVSPCGAPVIFAALAYVSQTGNVFLGFIVFFAMALGLGILFIIIGTFSGVLASLPRSGGWMEVIKKAMGVALIAGALWYGRILIRPNAFPSVIVVAAIMSGIYLSEILKQGLKAPKGLLALSVITILLGILAGLWIGTPKPTPTAKTEDASPIPWMNSVMEAESRSITEQKPILIDVWADWCVKCEELAQTTFRDPRVVEEIKRFIPVKLDFSDTKSPQVEKWKQEYGIQQLPTVLFMDRNGELQKDLTVHDYISPEEMLKRMRQVK
ncbi:MAG: thioredoxin fold domain-containing protein [Planctomycetes bacterium]|nr:thioredoxin fold domain-containing protein [Planctomycetota bacterium]